MMQPLSTEQRETIVRSIEEILASEKEISELAAKEIRLECPNCRQIMVVPIREFYEKARVKPYRCVPCQAVLVGKGNDSFAVQMAGMQYAMEQGHMSEEQVRDALEVLLGMIRGGT